jgi:hypothetical protein
VFNNGDLFTEVEGVGNTEVKFEEGGNVSVQFKVQSTSAFQFTTSISVVKRQTFY